MKKLLATLFVLGIVGCGTLDRPPTAFEQKMFDVKTNLVEVAVPTTQTVVNGELVTVPGITSIVEQYEFLPNERQEAIKGTAKVVGSFWGVGDLAAALVGGAFGLWGMLRSRKSSKMASTLIQVIETGRQILQTTPQGQKLDDRWKTWMIQHQAEQGIINEVVKLVGQAANTEDAKLVSQKILDLMNRENQP